jgi:hypothetical protein
MLGAEAKGVVEGEHRVGGLAPALLVVGGRDELADGPGPLAGGGRDPGPGPGGIAVEDGKSAGAPRHCLVGQAARLHQVAEQRVGFGGQGQAPHQASSRIVGAQHGRGSGELAQGAGRPAL